MTEGKGSGSLANYAPPKVVGVADDDVEGYIPPEQLRDGIDVLIPRWPFYAESGEQDTLIVTFTQQGQPDFVISNVYDGPIPESGFTIRIGPEHLQNDGVAFVSYKTLNHQGNPAFSDPRTLTIDHTVIPGNLPEVSFPDATRYGYLNCSPFIKDGVELYFWEHLEIKVPPLTGFLIGDVCVLQWQGYDSLNGSGTPLTELLEVRRTLASQGEINNGLTVIIKHPETLPFVQPLKDNDSAVVRYSIFRGARPLARSLPAVVKIDRVIPGGLPAYCGPV